MPTIFTPSVTKKPHIALNAGEFGLTAPATAGLTATPSSHYMDETPPTEISMTRQDLSPYDRPWIRWGLLALALVLWPGSPALAADEPDLIFRRSTVFKFLSPNDKLATYGVDDPEVEGVACHFTVPEKGGFKGWLGLAEEV
jgi:hypothetical protein